MQIVIDMSEHEYEVALRDGWIHTFYSEKIKNGKPLPKGHGALKDADALFDKFEEAGWFNNADRDEVAEKILLHAPTILEADKEV